jgi:hypothetical protein
MAEKLVRICLGEIAGPEFRAAAKEKAIAERPGNVQNTTNGFEASVETAKLWSPGRVLRIKFLDGSQERQQQVIERASEWLQHVNLGFDFVDHGDAEIRISFGGGGGGSWSAVGTDCLITAFFPLNEPTMNFGDFHTRPPESVEGTILHEFGHAIGMTHEHQSAGSPIEWNEAQVLQELAGRWTPEMIQFNIFDRYSATQTQFTEFDDDSIMLYSFPARWTRNNRETHENNVLSPTDIAFMGQMYPR